MLKDSAWQTSVINYNLPNPMDILVAYDVNTQDKEGQKRLRKVAKICEGYGQRVQYSVFECTVSEVKLQAFRHRLLKVIDPDKDSLRIYHLHGRRQDIVEAYGRDTWVDYNGPLIV